MTHATKLIMVGSLQENIVVRRGSDSLNRKGASFSATALSDHGDTSDEQRILFNRHAPNDTIYKAVHCARVDGFGRLGRLGSVSCVCTRTVILAWSLYERRQNVH